MSGPVELETESKTVLEARIIALMIFGLAVGSSGIFVMVLEAMHPPIHPQHAGIGGGLIVLGGFFIWPKSLGILAGIVRPFMMGRPSSIVSITPKKEPEDVG